MVTSEIIDRIAFVTMQNGKHFNCLSDEMCSALTEAIDAAYEAKCVGIVLKAEVNKGVWSAGHDIHELPTDGRDPLAYEVPMERLLRKEPRFAARAGEHGFLISWSGGLYLLDTEARECRLLQAQHRLHGLYHQAAAPAQAASQYPGFPARNNIFLPPAGKVPGAFLLLIPCHDSAHRHYDRTLLHPYRRY